MSTRNGYLQARVQAHYALLPDDRLWLHLSALKELASFMEEVRSTQLAQWIFGLSSHSSAEEIESHMHRRFGDSVTETARWFGAEWRSAVRWLATLGELPALEHALRSNTVPATTETEPELLELAKLTHRDLGLRRAWIRSWRSRWPALSRRDRQGVESLVEILERHWQQFPLLPVDATWNARRDLEARMRLFFRSHLLQPAAAFAYLALVALCLERLRAELLHRALFSQQARLS